MTSLRAVIFDLGGLLADTEPLHYAAWSAVIKSEFGFNVTWDEYCDHWIRLGLGIPEFMEGHGIVRDPAERWQLKSRRYLALVVGSLEDVTLETLERLVQER